MSGVVVVVAPLILYALPAHAAAQSTGTPTPIYSCDGATPSVARPGTSPGGMAMGTPMAGMAMEFDQLYIDMMIPHHASIVAMAQAILPRLADQRLQEMARNIVDAQSAEVDELRGYRQHFYGSAEPMPMDPTMMGMMANLMPGMGAMDQMAAQMDPATQVAIVCVASNADVAFIDATISHHQMAIMASQAALQQASHVEIKALAQRVIEDQQREITDITSIRAELSDMATPGVDA